MTKTKRAKKKLHKAEMKAKIVKFEQLQLQLSMVLESDKEATAQVQAIRNILNNAPNKVVAPLNKDKVTEKVTHEETAKKEEAKVETGNDNLVDLRLDVATTLYTHLCNEGDSVDATYEEVLIEKINTFIREGHELDGNDFGNCDTKQRIFIHIQDDTRKHIEDLAKKHKLAKRSVVESICTTIIRKG